jgi:hypothetical protein
MSNFILVGRFILLHCVGSVSNPLLSISFCTNFVGVSTPKLKSPY